MSTYATPAQLRTYADGLAPYDSMIPADDGDAARLIELAEQDLDAIAWPLAARVTGLPKIDPVADLDSDQRPGIVAAVCAQVLYRLEMGNEHFVRAQRQRVQSRAGSTEGKLPILGPQAERELAAASLWRLTTSTTGRVDGDPERWQAQ